MKSAAFLWQRRRLDHEIQEEIQEAVRAQGDVIFG